MYNTDGHDLLHQVLKSVGSVVLINDTMKTTRKSTIRAQGCIIQWSPRISLMEPDNRNLIKKRIILQNQYSSLIINAQLQSLCLPYQS